MCANFSLEECGRLGATRAHTREVGPPCSFRMPLTDEISPDVDPSSEGAAVDVIVQTAPPPERSPTPDRDMSRSTTLDATPSSSSRMTPEAQRRTSLFPYVTLSPPAPRAPKEEVKPDVGTIYSGTPSVSATRGTSATGSSGQSGSAQPSSITLSSSRAAESRPTASSSVAREMVSRPGAESVIAAPFVRRRGPSRTPERDGPRVGGGRPGVARSPATPEPSCPPPRLATPSHKRSFKGRSAPVPR